LETSKTKLNKQAPQVKVIHRKKNTDYNDLFSDNKNDKVQGMCRMHDKIRVKENLGIPIIGNKLLKNCFMVRKKIYPNPKIRITVKTKTFIRKSWIKSKDS